jgi:hypothetical protein
MLPFMWSEDATCDAQPKPLVSGIEILFGKDFDSPGPGLIFVALLLVSLGLGFLATRTQRPWRRLAAETVAGLASIGTTLMCIMMMTTGRRDQPLDHPAAWIGTLSALAMAFEACWCSGEALRRGLDYRRARRAERARITAGAAPLRIAAGGGGAPEREDEPEEEEEGATKPARKRVLNHRA